MDVNTESSLTEFGRTDILLHEMECACCGMMTERLYNVSKGYAAEPVHSLPSKLQNFASQRR